jgi:hypothetical protein
VRSRTDFDQQIILMEAYRLGYDKDAKVAHVFWQTKSKRLAARPNSTQRSSWSRSPTPSFVNINGWMHKVNDIILHPDRTGFER